MVSESSATFWARELQLRWLWRWWAEVVKFVDPKSVEHLETVLERPVGGGGNVLHLGLKFERKVVERAPFGWAAADVVEKIVVGGGAVVRDATK